MCVTRERRDVYHSVTIRQVYVCVPLILVSRTIRFNLKFAIAAISFPTLVSTLAYFAFTSRDDPKDLFLPPKKRHAFFFRKLTGQYRENTTMRLHHHSKHVARNVAACARDIVPSSLRTPSRAECNFRNVRDAIRLAQGRACCLVT